MLKQNIGLITSRQQALAGFRHISVTNTIIESAAASIKTKEWNYIFPLYLYSEKFEQLVIGESVFIDAAPRPNINADMGKNIAKNIDSVYCPTRELLEKEGVSRLLPEDIFYYTYAILHSTTYRIRYAEQLKIDFPRLPLTTNKKLFAQLICMGNELVNIHLLGENPFDKSNTIFDDSVKWGVKIGGTKPEKLPDWQVADIRYEEKDKRVYVNKGQYFEGIEKDVWEFMIGSYQVCEKWLKERKKAERALSTDDLKHYMKIVVSLRETIRIMSEIDRCIDEHGGWPIK
jgi:predicted helicase